MHNATKPGNTTKPTPVTDKITDSVVAPVMATVWSDFII